MHECVLLHIYIYLLHNLSIPATISIIQIVFLNSFRTDLGPKFGMSQPKFGQSVSQQGFFTSHDSLATPCASRASNSHMANVSTASEMDLLHNNKQRPNNNKSRGRLKTIGGDQPLLGTWNRSTGRGSQDNTLSGGGAGGAGGGGAGGGAGATNMLMGHTQYGGNYCNGTDR